MAAAAIWVAIPLAFVVGTLVSPDQQLYLQREIAIVQQSNDVRQTNDTSTVNKLKQLSLSDVHWANIDIRTALADLEAQSKEVDPAHIGFHFSVRLPKKESQADVLDRNVHRNVCIIRHEKTTFLELLFNLSGQTNLSFDVQRNSVIFRQWQPDDFLWLDLNS